MSMKLKFFLFIFLTSLMLMQFNSPNQQIRGLIKQNLESLYKSSENFSLVAEQYKQNKVPIEKLRIQLILVRSSYKKVEHIVEYFFPSFAEEHLNGAPLLHTETFSNTPIVVPPEGLQTLDELVFSEDIIDKNEVFILGKKLEGKIKELLDGFPQLMISEKELVEATKMELIRVFTLGLSGFDTPGSQRALPEAKIVFENLRVQMTDLELDTDKEILLLVDLGISKLKANKEFNEFDRFSFLTEVINPLYKELNELFPSNKNKKTSINPLANSLFDPSFLDPYYFTLLDGKKDNSQLRELGKKLFSDPILSQDLSMSCQSCHNPKKGFTDGVAKSVVNDKGETTLRNSPTLLNAVYSDRYFYDLRAFNLEQQVEHVIFNEKEFGTTYESILKKLNANKEYSSLFNQVFGKKKITRENFSQSLSSYVLSLQSFNSEFDHYVRTPEIKIPTKIREGFNLFMGKAACGTCHFPPTFSGLVPPYYVKNESEILGVLESPLNFNKRIDSDKGRIDNKIQSESAWIYTKSFKTNSVRNVSVTAPYFHNGAYPTLESVIDFYNHGGGAGIGLDVKNQTLSSDSLNLTKPEKESLILFLNSLTDSNY